jgi:hypothetical protein
VPPAGLTLAELLGLLPEPVRRGRLDVTQAIMTDRSSFEPRLRELVRLRSAGLVGCHF